MVEREEKYNRETEGWFDVEPFEPVEDRRNIRNDYVPSHPIHPKERNGT